MTEKLTWKQKYDYSNKHLTIAQRNEIDFAYMNGYDMRKAVSSLKMYKYPNIDTKATTYRIQALDSRRLKMKNENTSLRNKRDKVKQNLRKYYKRTGITPDERSYFLSKYYQTGDENFINSA